MHITSKHIVPLIIKKCRVEYNGTHNADRENPLYGRHAYWRIYIGDTYVCKVTAPVRSINPKPATLAKLLEQELAKRIEAIGEVVEFDRYSEAHIYQRDPYHVRPLLSVLKGVYQDIESRNSA